MKRAKLMIPAVLTALLIAILAGCSTLDTLKNRWRMIVSHSDVTVSETDKGPGTIDALLEALDKRDGEQFKSLFSKTVLGLADDMDKGLAYIFSLYEGEYTQTVYHNYSADKHYGEKNTTLINAIYVIRTTADKYYRIRYSIWTVQEKDPDSVGIYSLDFCECEKNQKGGGGGSWLAGISYPERDGVEKAAGNIADIMITGDEKYLREILSDELLAMDGIDEKITAFAKDYSTINPSTVGDSWAHVREDGAFGYLVANTRPRTFIVFEMSDEQPDKIRGMKVTIVDVNDPLPEQGIEPGGTGLFYPKFPHGK